jgi:hypothetical protein
MARMHDTCDAAMSWNGRDGFGWERSSRGRFATRADFPIHDRSPFRGLHVAYDANVCALSIVQRPFSVAPCQP